MALFAHPFGGRPLAGLPLARTVVGVKVVATHGLGSCSAAMHTLLSPVFPHAVYVQAPTRAKLPRTQAWVDAVVEVADGGPVLLLGHSWGGAVMLQAAAVLPDAFAVLVCPPCHLPGTRAAAAKVPGRVVVVAGSHDALLRSAPARLAAWAHAPLLTVEGMTHSGFLRPAPRAAMKLEIAASRSPLTRLAQRHALREVLALVRDAVTGSGLYAAALT